MGGTAFTGFPETGLRFLTGLAKNNDRVWFNARKATYTEDVQAPLHALVEALNERFRAARMPLASDPRRIAFRIYRDVRFSNDKSPYKTHASAVMYRHGSREAPGLFYVHIDPKAPFFAAGFYQPDTGHLRALRDAIVDDPRAFRTIVSKLSRAGYELSNDDALMRLPRGYETTDEALAPFIKRKSFVVSHEVKPALLRSPKLVDEAVTFAKRALPLLEWGWEATG